MFSRRDFLGTATLAAASSVIRADALEPGPRKKLAVVTTEWRYHSHAWHMAERFLAGYPVGGGGTARRSTWCPRTSTSSRSGT